MMYRIETRELAERPTAVLRAWLPAAPLGAGLPDAYQEVMDGIPGRRIRRRTSRTPVRPIQPADERVIEVKG